MQKIAAARLKDQQIRQEFLTEYERKDREAQEKLAQFEMRKA